MTGMQGFFDANQFSPKQAMDKHPVGQFPFTITGTEIIPTKDQQGGMFVVTFTTPAGQIQHRYNLWNNSAQAVEIAHGQLSALCHATGAFRLNWQDEGAALRNARGQLVVGWQKGNEPSAENPAGGYVEVKKVLDSNGNEPGKANSGMQQPQVSQPQVQTVTAQPPMQQNPQGGWAQPNQNPGQQTNQNPTPQGWGGTPQQQPQPNQVQPGAVQQNPGWSQTAQPGQATNSPPWAQK